MFTIEDALKETQKTYQLKLLAGKRGIKNSISWVHLIEDTTIIHQFWGNELAVTTGLGFKSEERLLELVELLIEHHGAGLIVNIGQHLGTIPPNILSLCEEHDFPLLTVPWEVYVADLIKDYCIRSFSTQNEEQEIARLCIHALEQPSDIIACRKELSSFFHVEGTFFVLTASAHALQTPDLMERQKIRFALRSFLDALPYVCSFFTYQNDFLVILNDVSGAQLKEFLHRLTEKGKQENGWSSFSYGCSSCFCDFSSLPLGYEQAKTALALALRKKQHTVTFSDMGIEQLFFNPKNTILLKQIYEDTLAPLRSFDALHHADYEDTLFYYLKYNGSIQAVSAALFTHRNTVNYRMGKIKEILGCEFSTAEERFPYLLAFHIRASLL